MKAHRFWVLVVLSCFAASAQHQGKTSAIPQPSSTLETFLANNPGAIVVKKQTGTLLGSHGEKAIFTAIVAYSTANRSAKLKGLEILVTDGQGTRALYLDYEPAVPPERDDNLQRFLEALDGLADKDSVIQGFQKERPGATFRETTVGVDAHGVVSLNIGWYKADEDMGVTINGAGGLFGVACFPGATVSQAEVSIKSAREFLVAN